MDKAIRERLEYLRGELRAERISTGELVELQSLADHIEAGDAELLEAAGVSEEDARKEGRNMTVETEERFGEQYPRIEGHKVLAVFEDHTGGGSARFFYAVHPDGRGLVAIASRKHPGFLRVKYRNDDHAEARRMFMLEIERYVPERSSVAD